MTLPHERTRAVIQAHELLKRLELDSSISNELRGVASQVLRHYPTRGEVLLQGLIEEQLQGTLRISPFFASSLTYQPMSARVEGLKWRGLCGKLAAVLVRCHASR